MLRMQISLRPIQLTFARARELKGCDLSAKCQYSPKSNALVQKLFCCLQIHETTKSEKLQLL